LMARAADKVFVTAEKVVPTAELEMVRNYRFNLFERAVVTGVVEAPFGAHPSSAAPDYQLDLGHLKTYADGAASAEAWAAYRARFIDVTDADYLTAIGGAEHIRTLKTPTY
jgi:glutaconate CoA-transferase subunit A